MNKYPHFLILGAQKSASTYVHDVLKSHPDIYMPDHEVRFFEDPEYDIDQYEKLESLFKNKNNKMYGIKRPDYLARPEVPARIFHHIPNAKLIIILREPVARLVSAYYYYIKLGLLPAVDINQGLPEIIKGNYNNYSKSDEILSYGKYATSLDRYFKFFKKEQILILFQEDFLAKPEIVLNKLFSFLDVNPYTKVEKLNYSNKGLYSLSRLKFLSKRNKYIYEYDVHGKIILKKDFVKFTMAGIITIIDRCLLKYIYKNKKPILDASLLTTLKIFYKEEIERLESMLQCKLDHWK